MEKIRFTARKQDLIQINNPDILHYPLNPSEFPDTWIEAMKTRVEELKHKGYIGMHKLEY